MKILHVIDSLAIGGRERRLLEFLKELGKHPDVESCLAVLSDEILFPHVQSMNINMVCLPRSGKKDLSIFRKLYRLCRSYQPDIIHSWEAMCSIYALPTAKLLNIGFVNGMISDASRLKIGGAKWVRSRLTFPFSDLILANSRAGLLAYKAPDYKSACVHNGFDFNRLRSLLPGGQIRRRLNIHTPKVIGMVATIDHRKDHYNFTRAAIRICNERRDVSFVALGDGPLKDRCRQMVPENLSGRIIFPGSCPNIESYVQVFDIGMLLTHGEGISNSIMEYMASAKPVIATMAGGTCELVLHGKTGVLIPSNTDQRLNGYIHDLLDDPEKAAHMGRAGKRRIQSHFSIENMCSEIVALYTKCLNARKNPLLQCSVQAAHGSKIVRKTDPDLPK